MFKLIERLKLSCTLGNVHAIVDWDSFGESLEVLSEDLLGGDDWNCCSCSDSVAFVLSVYAEQRGLGRSWRKEMERTSLLRFRNAVDVNLISINPIP